MTKPAMGLYGVGLFQSFCQSLSSAETMTNSRGLVRTWKSEGAHFCAHGSVYTLYDATEWPRFLYVRFMIFHMK